MDERNMNTNDIFSSSQPHDNAYHDGYQTQQPVTEVSPSVEEQPADRQPAAPDPVIMQSPVKNPPVQMTPQPVYSYEHYASQFDHQSRQASVPAKKSKKGKKVALIACSLALAVCLGFGGGIAGAYLMGANNTQTIVKTVDGKEVAANTSDGNNSGLTIVEAAASAKTANSIEEVVAAVKDSVVEITTESTSYSSFYGQYVTQGAGSGVIISSDGYLVTNNHVIDGATNITVKTTDGKTYQGTVVGADETFDIALVKIDATDLKVAVMGDSSALKVGETSIVIGNPLGNLGGSVTKGIVSALNRNIKIDGKVMELLQTDAAINPGNSGGGMFDAEGNLIGIVVAKSIRATDGTTVESIGYAIPINNVKLILGDLKEKGYVSGRAALGVTLTDVTTETAKQRYNVDQLGIYISSLTSGGAAEKAGFMVGDRIVKIDDVSVASSAEVRMILLKHKAGDTIKITLDRDGKEQTISVKLEEESKNQSDSQKGRNSNNFDPNGGNNGNNGSNGNGGYDDFDIDDWYKYFLD